MMAIFVLRDSLEHFNYILRFDNLTHRVSVNVELYDVSHVKAQDENVPLATHENEVIRLETLMRCISVLNASFGVDYSFEGINSARFSKKDIRSVQKEVNNILIVSSSNRIKEESLYVLWKTIGEEVDFHQCQIFSYISEREEGEPYSETLFYRNYFFINENTGLMVFFNILATTF